MNNEVEEAIESSDIGSALQTLTLNNEILEEIFEVDFILSYNISIYILQELFY